MVPSRHRGQGLQALVDRQVRLWRLEKKSARDLDRKHETKPLICVSREFGSQGARIGQIAAEKLDFSFWDQELVHTVAEETGTHESLLESLDEHARSALEDTLADMWFGSVGTEVEYVRQVGKIAHTIDHHGSAVVIGRGVQFMLPPERSLRIRVVADSKFRVESYSERVGISQQSAEKKIASVERDRHEFYRRYFNKDVTDPSHYDLLINAGSMSLEKGADLMIAAYNTKFSVR